MASERDRVSKEYWYHIGGFSNRNCYRVQSKGGGWRYYVHGGYSGTY